MAKSKGGGTQTVNLKQGLPDVEEARRRLNSAIDRGRQSGAHSLKLIHGYGSSGIGGGIKVAIHKSLRRRKKEGRIRAFVPGEKWHVCEEQAQQALDLCPDLNRDPDLNQFNEGVTIVVL